MLSNGNGSTHHRIGEATVDRLVAAGFMQEADREDGEAVGKALDNLLAKFKTPPAGRPLHNLFVTPQMEVAAQTHLTLGLMEVLIALDVLPPQAIAAVFVHARAMATAAYAPAGIHELLGHYAEVLDWSLKRHGATVDAKAIKNWGAK
jgi:hypothetical protein